MENTPNKNHEKIITPEQLFEQAVDSALEHGFSIVPAPAGEHDSSDIVDATMTLLNGRSEDGREVYKKAPIASNIGSTGDFFVLPRGGEKTVAAFVVGSGAGEVQVLQGKDVDVVQIESGSVVLVDTSESSRNKRPRIRFEDNEGADALRIAAIGVNGDLDSDPYSAGDYATMGAVNRRRLAAESSNEQNRVQSRYQKAQRRLAAKALSLDV